MKETDMKDIIDFWFNELQPEQWFTRDPQLDKHITERFLHAHQQAIQGKFSTWRQNAEGRLAEIIIIDQFSRNIFRNDTRSFDYDPIALSLAQEAVENHCHRQLPPIQAGFLLMPYMHSESATIHQEAVSLFSATGLEKNLEFELKHKSIIDRFGRYPHRNKILNRQSTPEEIDFLKDNPGF